jgi:enoyl-CoA hydratase/carnithine racemase
MNPNDLIVSYPGFFVSELHEDALWLKLSGNFFHNFIRFDHRDFLHDYLRQVAGDTRVKTVVIHSAFHESGSDEYLRFFLLECPKRDLGHFGFSNTMDRYDLHRFCNIIDRTILDIASLNKMVIHICGGDVLSLFMNVSLACDYRIIANDTVFHNVFQEIGMLPKGGAPFYLGRLLGPGRVNELLLLKSRITSEEALENFIADRVVAPEDLETTAMGIARTFSQISDPTLSGVKRLTRYSMKQLKDYLEYETEEIVKVGRRDRFGDQ